MVYYTWEDAEYRDYMNLILRNIEPRFAEAGSILFNELDEVNEVIFISKG